ncbi:MAG: GAF domain-containing protein, partial [Acidobacteriota bacterium]
SGESFRWPAIAGEWTPYVGGGTPRSFGPCGTVLDRDTTILFVHPERHFGYLESATPSIEEALLVPFYVNGEAVGTIWAISHSPSRQFDAEDARLLNALARFTAVAHRTLIDIGALEI